MSFPRSRFALPAVLLLALAAAACSGATDPSSEPAEADPTPTATAAAAATDSLPTDAPGNDAPELGTALNACEIVTADDVGTVLADLAGETVTVPAGQLVESPTVLSPGHTDCAYGGEWGGLKVSLTPEDGANLYDAALGSYADPEELQIGDGAFWSKSTKRGFFWKGNVTVMLQISHLTVPADFGEATVALGEQAIARV